MSPTRGADFGHLPRSFILPCDQHLHKIRARSGLLLGPGRLLRRIARREIAAAFLQHQRRDGAWAAEGIEARRRRSRGESSGRCSRNHVVLDELPVLARRFA